MRVHIAQLSITRKEGILASSSALVIHFLAE
jgi:hypothetical protein